MLTIQQVGQEILGHAPKSFYVFTGTEYGIKDKYIQILSDIYGSKVEAPRVSDILAMMRTKHLIPLQPVVYVIRYDEEFLSTLSNSTASEISKTKIIGTIVCLYEQPKHVTKVEKYLPDYTVSIDNVSPQFIHKYLSQDFPNLSDRLIKIAVESSANYGQAKNICRSMCAAPINLLEGMTDADISQTFGYTDTSTETMIRVGVAARNFPYLMKVIENYDGDGDRILYAVLQTMIELDKLLDNSHIQSDLKPYIKLWTREDVYYMFMNSYLELQKLRSTSSYDVKNSITYLVGLLPFQRIPAPEVMNA